jgi:hypothetical protein
MAVKINKKMDRSHFAAAVVRQLEKSEITCVLVGGSCVSIYTDERHHSRDLDFISPYSVEIIAKSLEEIGFTKSGRYFTHSDSEFYVEFPSGPPGIGNEVPIEVEGRLKVDGVVIKLYSPTQCVMDRLAAWYHWKDRQSLIHALWVAERQPVKIQKIKKWSENEGESEKFAEFLAEYKKLGTK